MKHVIRALLPLIVLLSYDAYAAAPVAAATPSITKGRPGITSVSSNTTQGSSVQTNASNATTTCANGCYYYNEEGQVTSETGASVDMTVNDPVVGPNDFHSLIEIAIINPDDSYVELGWTVDPGLNGDKLPHLFVSSWVKNVWGCYNACGYISLKTPIQPGKALPVGPTASFKISYRTSPAGWYMTYNGTDMGYYPESRWSGEFTKGSLVQVYGEVCAVGSEPHTQMGNGKFGNSTSSSSSVSNFSLIGAPTAGVLGVNTGALTGNLYTIGSPTTTGFHYGGPGAYGPGGQITTSPTPPPTVAPTASPKPTIPGDVNGDGKVNALDLSILLTHWGSSGPTADINHDGTVNVLDLSIVLAHYSGA